MVSITSAMLLTKNTETENARSDRFSSWPLLAIKVKKNVNPTSERKRSLLSNATMGRKNGITVAYASSRETAVARAIAWRFR
jgi:hypothetical protein